jgi:hypothetical protein
MFFDIMGKCQGSTESLATKTNRRLKAEVKRRTGRMKINQGWAVTEAVGRIRGEYRKLLTVSL